MDYFAGKHQARSNRLDFHYLFIFVISAMWTDMMGPFNVMTLGTLTVGWGAEMMVRPPHPFF